MTNNILDLLKKNAMLFFYLILMAAAFLSFQIDVVLFLALTALGLLCLLQIVTQQQKIITILVIGIFGVVTSVNAITYEFGVWYMVYMAIVFLIVGLFEYNHFVASREIALSNKQKKHVIAEKQELEYKHEIKNESLIDLEKQVDEIFKLFEVAKDFNECIALNAVGMILTEKVFYKLPFARGVLMILEGKKKKNIYKTFLFSEKRWEENDEVGTYDIAKLIAFLSSNKRPITIHNETKMSYDFVVGRIKDPVWIFPLMVEGKMIAVFILEGGRQEDYAKYSIIAAQLALQIKKINLYNTVKELSITDGLTGVFVRRHFLERFNEELKRSIKNEFTLTVLMLDIDYFKKYNDTFGHLVGDVTLREVARIIRDNVRKVDLIARYGGEEFAIVLPETDEQGGWEAAERIRSAVAAKKFRVYDEETRVTVSIGFATFPNHVAVQDRDFQPDRALQLLQKADQALYKSKEDGRDRITCYRNLS